MAISTVTAAQDDFIAKSGDTFGPVLLQYFTLVNNVETPIDITGDTFELNVVVRKGAVPVLVFTNGNGFTIQNTNELVMSKSATQMSGLEARDYIYQLERTQANGIVSTEMEGKFTIEEDFI